MTGLLLATASEVPEGDAWLHPVELAVQAGLLMPRRRGDWRLGRWTAKRAVGVALGVAARRVHVEAAADGAPEAYVDGVPADLAVSISHRAGCAVCAVGRAGVGVGCDLETVEPRAAVFVSDWFTRREQGLVHAASPAARDAVTTLLWSAKESALKALRCGLRRDTRSVEVTPGGRGRDGWERLRVVDLECGAPLDGWWRPLPGLVLTVVTTSPAGPPHALFVTRAVGAGAR